MLVEARKLTSQRPEFETVFQHSNTSSPQDSNRYYTPKYDIFPSLTMQISCLNLTFVVCRNVYCQKSIGLLQQVIIFQHIITNLYISFWWAWINNIFLCLHWWACGIKCMNFYWCISWLKIKFESYFNMTVNTLLSWMAECFFHCHTFSYNIKMKSERKKKTKKTNKLFFISLLPAPNAMQKRALSSLTWRHIIHVKMLNTSLEWDHVSWKIHVTVWSNVFIYQAKYFSCWHRLMTLAKARRTGVVSLAWRTHAHGCTKIHCKILFSYQYY